MRVLIFFDGENSDIYALEPVINNNIVYASIYSNKSTYHMYKDNITYNELMKQVIKLCTTVK